MPTITLIGLGPGDPALLTAMAREVLASLAVVYTPVPDHPALAGASTLDVRTLPGNGKAAAAALCGYAAHGAESSCALPGHPNEHPLFAAFQQANAGAPYTLRVIPGISFVDAVCDALNVTRHGTALQVVAGETLLHPRTVSPDGSAPAWCDRHGAGTYSAPLVPYPLLPTQPALIWLNHPAGDTENGPALVTATISELRHVLCTRYPPSHPARTVQLDRYGQVVQIRNDLLGQLGEDPAHAAMHALYLPELDPMANLRSADGLNWVVARLLGPGGCPWDHQQTHQSLRTSLLEEAHEVLEALDAGDMPALAEELGDLLLQVLVHSEMARQAGLFDLGNVLEQISVKLVRRHPHVFNGLAVDDASQVLHNWEAIKAQELREKGRQRASVLDGIPTGLPALAAAQKLVSRAARTGFEWSSIQQVWDKLQEELGELTRAAGRDHTTLGVDEREHLAEELGDVLFVMVNLARWLDLDAESALRAASQKFRRRFTRVERYVQEQGQAPDQLALPELLALWQRAKQEETTSRLTRD